jgi:hypothetical protein
LPADVVERCRINLGLSQGRLAALATETNQRFRETIDLLA